MFSEASISSTSAVKSPAASEPGQRQSVGEPVEKAPKGVEESPQPEADRNPELREAVRNLNDALHVAKRALQFRIDSDSGRTVITVIDQETDEIIRQIPAEELLAIIHHLDLDSGLIVRDQA